MKSDIPIIDSHWHLYCWQDQNGIDFRTLIDQRIKDSNLYTINICSIPIYTNIGPQQNILAALYKLHNPKAYAYGGLVYPQKPFQAPMPEGMDPLTQYEELMALGFDGIKMLETKPTEQKQFGIEIDDPYFDKLFHECEKNRTHMIWHVADPSTFWDIEKIPKRFLDRGWFYGDGTYMSHERIYEQVYNVLSVYPNLNVTFAHFFFMSEKPEQLKALFEKYPNVTVDITPGSEMFADFRNNHTYYRDFFTKYSHRIILGSDTSVNGGDMERFIQRGHALQTFISTDQEVTVIAESCKGLSLPQDAQERILSQNFLSAVGHEPKPIDRAALKRYVEKYKHLFSDVKMLHHIQNEVDKF